MAQQGSSFSKFKLDLIIVLEVFIGVVHLMLTVLTFERNLAALSIKQQYDALTT